MWTFRFPATILSATAAFAFALLAGGGTGAAQEITTTPLEGELFIAGKTPIDPPPRERKNTHAYVTIKGPAALRMYDGMTGRVRPDECRGDGWTMKVARNLQCSKSSDGKAECDFSVNLRRGALAAGQPC